jgi:hypothetical protein
MHYHALARGRRYVAIGWPIERDGCMLEAGTAILSADGDLLAIARAIWIELPDAAG